MAVLLLHLAWTKQMKWARKPARRANTGPRKLRVIDVLGLFEKKAVVEPEPEEVREKAPIETGTW